MIQRPSGVQVAISSSGPGLSCLAFAPDWSAIHIWYSLGRILVNTMEFAAEQFATSSETIPDDVNNCLRLLPSAALTKSPLESARSSCPSEIQATEIRSRTPYLCPVEIAANVKGPLAECTSVVYTV